MAIPTRLEEHSEHYERLEALYDMTHESVTDVVLPYIEQYTNAGLPVLLLAGASLRFETGEEHEKASVLMGVDLRIDPTAVSSFSLFLQTASQEILGGVSPNHKEFNPGQFKKYKIEESMEKARRIAKVLAEGPTVLMGLDLRPLRAGAPNLAVVQGLARNIET